MNEKKAVYEKKKVKEYWTVASVAKAVRGFELGTKGLKKLPASVGVINSKLMGKLFKF